jgi:hypothetical protein
MSELVPSACVNTMLSVVLEALPFQLLASGVVMLPLIILMFDEPFA